jgi:cytochrome c-type biogenesis protein CcmH
MTQFWIAALALGLAAAAIVLVPVLRAWVRQEGEERSSTALGVGIVVAFAVPVTAIMMYAHWSTWDWSTGGTRMAQNEAEAVHQMDEAIAALEQRLQRQPEDIESWMLLGRSYMSMRRFDDAAGAFRHAAILDGGQSPQVLADFGEALALSEPEGLMGEAGAIFERVLAMSPSHPKGLWYGGLNAYENANWELAKDRLSLLLTMSPPETLVPLIEERIASARTHMGAGGAPAMPAPAPVPEAVEPPPAVAQQPVVPDPEPEAAPPEEGPAVAAAPAGPVDAIRLEVQLDPALAGRLPGPAPVFIIARNAGGGPPLAVIRATSNELPMSVELSDANAMMEGVTIMDQPELELVARVALSGSPAQRPGDLFGAVNYTRGNGGTTRITIDRVAE